MRRAVSSIFALFFILLLSIGLLMSSYYIEQAEIQYSEFANTVPSYMRISVSYSAKNGMLNITNSGHQFVIVTHIIAVANNRLVVYNFSAGLNPGQTISVYFPFSATRYGVETNYGVVWS